MRLGPRPVVGRHDEEGGVDLARPDEHVSDELVVPRNIDEVELRAVGQIEMGVADVDRHPPPPFLRQSVGVDSGQRPKQRGLAMVDVARGPDDDGHDGLGAPTTAPIAAASSASRPGSTVRRSRIDPAVLDPAHDRRAPSPQGGERPIRRPRQATPRRTTAVSPRAANRPRRSPPSPRPRPFPRAARRALLRVRGARPERRRSSARRGSPPPPGRPGRGRASQPPRRASPCRAASPAPAGRAECARSGPPGRRRGRPGATDELVAAERHDVGPSARRSAGIGSWARPKRSVGRSAPEPRSSTTIAPWPWADRPATEDPESP